mmetsp:Transcript_6544/g.8502  ORF Transcript_6544/g.8502 Transcript_6544/m.8502 type:complete len:343 (-) Transcript_6544:263-1291(-)|eukprot:CAMPEP_0198146020 /NCGR_PEP_ID=MMETSP1443-20131203/26888_1 /TAXON_ID=186043 /ORGANISM="Entomoneis sp., Strain CCMP2396" /LENGTH=342 /DNA_ID=CAMNT_0043809821 /DNA_START=61 /DNA_END=1089 /DNA_ORIENTATION=+
MAPPASSGRKRPAAVKIETGFSGTARPIKHFKSDPGAAVALSEGVVDGEEELKERFVLMFNEPEFSTKGVSNTALKARFSTEEYTRLAPVINQFLSESRLTMSRAGGRNELFYTLISADLATKFNGLDVSARMVYQVVEKSGNMGVWTKDIKRETNIQNLALNKIFKALESRRLIKQVKSINAKSKKMYMLYDLEPSKELTGGIWYSDLEFDHGFITELRTFLMHCVRKLNQGNGVTVKEILGKMNQAKISRVNIGMNDVKQLMQTLVHDHIVEEILKENEELEAADAEGEENEVYYIASRRVSTMCEFKMWQDLLSTDFHFRTVCYEDGVQLESHEPHYHT